MVHLMIKVVVVVCGFKVRSGGVVVEWTLSAVITWC